MRNDSLSNRDQMTKRPDEDHPAGHRWRGHDHFAHRVCREQLERGASLDHEHVAVLARKVKPPVGVTGGSMTLAKALTVTSAAVS